jgi:hypothetical protein
MLETCSCSTPVLASYIRLYACTNKRPGKFRVKSVAIDSNYPGATYCTPNTHARTHAWRMTHNSSGILVLPFNPSEYSACSRHPTRTATAIRLEGNGPAAAAFNSIDIQPTKRIKTQQRIKAAKCTEPITTTTRVVNRAQASDT